MIIKICIAAELDGTNVQIEFTNSAKPIIIRLTILTTGGCMTEADYYVTVS